ncbi:MAG: DNA helicase II [Gammaproteobacteria bacterium]|nr:DNA helicase II [Gammaproteobacteria bacterium]
MDVSYLLDSLNDAQREAVSAPPAHRLVLAGAGSGKTRVLVHRIAWLIQVEHVSPYGVLAVTFTNKAAAEMRGRIEKILGIPVGGMWVGTFHGLAHRLLRAHWKEAGLPQTFQILDSDDQYRLIRRLLKAMELDEEKWPARQVQHFINGRKDEGIRPAHINHHEDLFLKQQVRIYEEYEALCNRGGLVDFAEMLLRAHEIWLNHPDLLAHYQSRFQHILVDEFQDTNTIQYAWLQLLAGKQSYLFVVGDDDQSIYGWRGAKIENIHRFSKDFPAVETVRLEQNYRSTAAILAAANGLITHNEGRLGKNLWTDGEQGDPVQVYAAFNEYDEAIYVIGRIQAWLEQGNVRSDVAILYRSNAQSRVFEEKLLQAGTPYRVYGGQRFFERAEIKDALAYLRLVANDNDDAAFERVVNHPPRGIGERSVATVRDYARQHEVSLMQAVQSIIENKILNGRACKALTGFLNILQQMKQGIDELQLDEQMEHVLEISRLREHYGKEKGEKGQSRIENLDELISAARQFEPNEDIEGLTPLLAFLAYAVLEAGEGQGSANEECVQLMTLHSAKGLEFPLVFLCGLEDGLFPHRMSMDDPARLEEERRLCYVGMTRACKVLILCHAERRRLHGMESFSRPSQFLREIPQDLLENIRVQNKAAQYSAKVLAQPSIPFPLEDTGTGLRIGQGVHHEKFGEGVILGLEGQGSHARAQVNFAHAGAKWLVLSYAKLTPM